MRFSFISLPMILILIGSFVYIFVSIRSLFRLARYRHSGVRTKGRLCDPPVEKADNQLRLMMTYICGGNSFNGRSDEMLTITENMLKDRFFPDQEYDVIVDPKDNSTFIPESEIRSTMKSYLIAIPLCIGIIIVLLYIIIFGIKIPFIDKIFESIRGY